MARAKGPRSEPEANEVQKGRVRAPTQEFLEARARAYLLLADLLEWGPSKKTRDAATMSPILAEALTDAPDDELDATHTSAFGIQVFPYAGVFLHPSAQAGADAALLYALYEALDFLPDGLGAGADHLATTFRALAHANPHASDATRELLDRHLLQWLPAWVSAVRRLEMAWPSALADQLLELVLFHRGELGERRSQPEPLAPLPNLDAEETDLRAIADALTTPAVAGLFLSRHDIASLARRSRTPTGFGPRSVMLENALVAAASYDTLTEVIGEIRAIYRRWQKELGELSARSVPGLEESIAPWRDRTHEAMALLEHIRVAARNAAA